MSKVYKGFLINKEMVLSRRDFLKIGLASVALANPLVGAACSSNKKDIMDSAREEGFEFVVDHLKKPTNLREISQKGFYIVALANLARGLHRRAKRHHEEKESIGKLLEEIAERAIHLAPCSLSGQMREEGYYLGNLNTILGLHREVTLDKKYEGVNQRVSEFLAQTTLADPQRHVRSFSGRADKYPADQSTVLYSLFLYDGNTGKGLHWEPVEQWLSFMREHATDPKTGLHISEVTGTKNGHLPRGCALSWETGYLARFKPSEARKLWGKYKSHFKENFIIAAGFREWPRGIERKADIDSGPIVRGIGAAATALGLVAAREIDDDTTYHQLKATEQIGSIYTEWSGDKSLQKASRDLLAKSIQFNYNQ